MDPIEDSTTTTTTAATDPLGALKSPLEGGLNALRGEGMRDVRDVGPQPRIWIGEPTCWMKGSCWTMTVTWGDTSSLDEDEAEAGLTLTT